MRGPEEFDLENPEFDPELEELLSEYAARAKSLLRMGGRIARETAAPDRKYPMSLIATTLLWMASRYAIAEDLMPEELREKCEERHDEFFEYADPRRMEWPEISARERKRYFDRAARLIHASMKRAERNPRKASAYDDIDGDVVEYSNLELAMRAAVAESLLSSGERAELRERLRMLKVGG